jgi:hypothetical protein
MPEWYLMTLGLAGMTLLGFSWSPLFWLWPLLLLAILVPLAQVLSSAAKARFTTQTGGSRTTATKLYAITAVLHILQPMVRLIGRLGHRLTPWRQHGEKGFTVPRPMKLAYWSEQWYSPIEWLSVLERSLQSRRVLVRRGGDHDRWDLQTACGLLGGARLISTVEEHGGGKQLVRVRAWPRLSAAAIVLLPGAVLLAALAGADQAWAATVVLGSIALLGAYRSWRECSAALHTLKITVENWLPGARIR